MLIVDKYREERMTKFLGIPLVADKWEPDELLVLIYTQITIIRLFLI